MKKRRSLFLLEVVIAIALVGLFSVYFLHSSLYQIYEERKALLELEFEWQKDLYKMDLIEQRWNRAFIKDKEAMNKIYLIKRDKKEYSKTVAYQLSCSQESDKGYLFALEEEKKNYHFFVKK